MGEFFKPSRTSDLGDTALEKNRPKDSGRFFTEEFF